MLLTHSPNPAQRKQRVPNSIDCGAGTVEAFQEVIGTRIPGCYLIRPWRRHDERGLFVKTFHASAFRELGLEHNFRESYYSISRKGVLRGMHFQRPPSDHAKLVYCVTGTILDAFVDLRGGSGVFGAHECVELSAENGLVLYLPPGVAHGFYVLSDEAITVYHVAVEYDPVADSGVRWDTCGIPWPTASPILSVRDCNLPPLEEARDLFPSELNDERK
jgi:dTDP-4-dehydrorhamnose 3,5-epimerase